MHSPLGPYAIRHATDRNRRVHHVLLGAWISALLFFPGCGSKSENRSQIDATPPTELDQRAPVSPREAGGQSTLAEMQRLIEQGRPSAALDLAKEHLVGNPEDAQAMVIAAQAHHLEGDTGQAIELLNAASERWPENRANLQARVANLLAEQQRWQEAIDRLRSVLKTDPEMENARRSLAAMLNLRGFRFDANQQVLELCRRGGATPEELRGLIWPARTFVTFSEKPDVSSPKEIERLGVMSAARALYGQGDLRDALTALNRSSLIESKDPAAYAFFGQVLIEAQQFDRIPDWIASTPQACTRYPAYWMAMGGWALHLGEHDIAVRMFAEAVQREPGDPAAVHRLTQALDAVGNTKQADAFRERSEQLNQLMQIAKVVFENPSAGPKNISDLSSMLGKLGRPFEALAWHRLALARFGANPTAMKQLEDQVARVRLTEQNDPDYLRSVVLLGLDLSRYPVETARLVQPQPSDFAAQSSIDSQEYEPVVDVPVFVNVATDVGLNFRYQNAPDPVEKEFRIFQAYGGGVACVDYDLDGRIDFYLGQGSGEPPERSGTKPNLLARNLGEQFVDVTQSANVDDRHYTCAVTSGDWNQDGLPDLLIGNMQANRLLINQGDGTFRHQPGNSQWEDPRYTTGLAIADLDGDHLPDIVEVNYLDDDQIYAPIERNADGTPVKLPGPLHFQAAEDRVFRSRGDGTMEAKGLPWSAKNFAANESAETNSAAVKTQSPTAGSSVVGTALGLLVTNLDGQEGNEVFVANDLMANRLWKRTGEAASSSWSDVAVVSGVAYGANGMPLACMGIAAADFDGNGLLDLHITNFEDQWSNQYMQRETGVFVDQVLPLGLEQDSLKMLGFGAQAFDYDNNATVDLVVGNGHVEDYRERGSLFEMPTQVFAWDRGAFRRMSVEGDPSYWRRGHLSRAVAKCDWNDDGKIDVLVSDLKEPVALLENRTENDNRWIKLKLVGTQSERDAIGAVAIVKTSNGVFRQVVQTGDGYMAKNESILAFGLAGESRVQSLEVYWPSGQASRFENVEANRTWLVVEEAQQLFEIESGFKVAEPK